MTDQIVTAQRVAESTKPVLETSVAQAPATDTTSLPRLPSLVGLRGVAALAVVISHILNTDPGLVHPGVGSVAWWFSYTPVNLLWDGDESVLLFFVLSGFVLARPFTRRNQSQSYLSYYPRRLLRLYPPLWGGLIFTFLLTLVESRHSIAAATSWTNSHSNFHLSTLQDALLPRVGTTFDGPLWSLRWEILFSLALPAYIVIARAFKRRSSVKVMVVVADHSHRVESVAGHAVDVGNNRHRPMLAQHGQELFLTVDDLNA